MSKTTFATNDTLTKQVYEEELFQDVMIESWAAKFMGETKNSLIQVKSDLTKEQGDKIIFGIRQLLTGDGVTSGQTLENNEERLTTYSYTLSLEQYRHAVRDNGAMSRQRAMFSIDNESRDALKEWGVQKIDKLCINALLASPTKTLYRDGVAGAFSGTATQSTAKTALTAANSKITPNFITGLRAWAMTGGNAATYRIRPVTIDGKSYYVLLVNPAVMYDLRTDSTFQSAMKDAQERGKENPLFRHSTAIWDDVVIHESERVALFTDGGGGSVVGSHGVLCGAQALCWAWGKRGSIVQDEFDYGNEHGYAWEMIAKAGKPVFNSKDYATVGVTLAASSVINV